MFKKLAMVMAALGLALVADASSASAQCNPATRLSEVHVGGRDVPRDGVDKIFTKFRNNPGLYDLVGCPRDLFGTARDGGAFIFFDRGAAYAAPGGRAVVIYGGILDKWAQYDYELGLLGYPTTDELNWIAPNTRYNRFENGLIVWHPDSGAHALYGAIGDAAVKKRGPNGEVLFPISEEIKSPGGKNNCPKSHRQQTFTALPFNLMYTVACWDANTGRVTWFTYSAIDLNGIPGGSTTFTTP